MTQPDTSWLRDLVTLASALVWPLVVLFLIMYFFKSKTAAVRISQILRNFRSFKIFGGEFILSEEGAKEISQTAEETFEAYRKQTKREFHRLAGVYHVREKLENVVQRHLDKALQKEKLGGIHNIGDFRCTIHVPDILFAETFYQLLDYYPRGGGRGRTWSIRFGIIGRAWRSGDDLAEGKVPSDPHDLILKWGMTREEAARAGQQRPSFLCVVLRDEQDTAVGLFYIDSAQEGAFGAKKGTQQRLCKSAVKGCKETGLTNALAQLSEELRRFSPQIRIYG